MPIARKKGAEGGENAPLSTPKKLILPKRNLVDINGNNLQTSAKSGGIKKRVIVPELPEELSKITNAVRGKYTNGVVRRGTDAVANYGRVSTGILSLDVCLAGGFRLSRGAMVYGEKSAGKTTIALRTVARMQLLFPDMFVVWIDVEGTFDNTWAIINGVDLERLLVLEPETGEDAVDLGDTYMRAKETSMLVTDSIAFITPQKEIEVSAEDQLPGLQARLIGRYLRKTNSALLSERHRGHMPLNFLINQFRMKIGVMFGDPRTLPGGKALEFAASQQVEAKNKEIKDEKTGTVRHNDHSFNVTKDKTGGRVKEGSFRLIRDEETSQLPVGYINQTGTILVHGNKFGICEVKGGGNFVVDDYNIKGEANVTKYFLDNPDREEEIKNAIVQSYRNKWGINDR